VAEIARTAFAPDWPERVAISDGDVSHTFAGLEEGALAVADWLAGHRVGAGNRVAILADKRATMPMLARRHLEAGGGLRPAGRRRATGAAARAADQAEPGGRDLG
jgi:non-ribosomal peptide synthetase component F